MVRFDHGHTEKESCWITVALDGTVEDEKLKFLLDMSYGLTKNSKKMNQIVSVREGD